MAIRNSHWRADLKEVDGVLMVELFHESDKQKITLPAHSVQHLTSVVEHVQQEVKAYDKAHPKEAATNTEGKTNAG